MVYSVCHALPELYEMQPEIQIVENFDFCFKSMIHSQIIQFSVMQHFQIHCCFCYDWDLLRHEQLNNLDIKHGTDMTNMKILII